MITRYDLLKPSKVLDIDKEEFPDPLTLNYREIISSGMFNIPQLQVDVTSSFLEMPYLLIWNYYSSKPSINSMDNKGQAYLDDIILDLNNVPHIDSLEEEDSVLFPDDKELSSFISSYMRVRA